MCFAFPSRRWLVMTLQVWVKKTRSHGCLWFSQASNHCEQEGIFPFACWVGIPWVESPHMQHSWSKQHGRLPGSPGCWMFTEGPISRALQGLKPGWARLHSQRWCVASAVLWTFGNNFFFSLPALLIGVMWTHEGENTAPFCLPEASPLYENSCFFGTTPS